MLYNFRQEFAKEQVIKKMDERDRILEDIVSLRAEQAIREKSFLERLKKTVELDKKQKELIKIEKDIANKCNYMEKEGILNFN